MKLNSKNVRSVLLITCLLVVPKLAWSSDPSAKAESLYTAAKKLAAEGRHSEACPMFEESQRIEPAIGTQFNLAACYESTARRATALVLFREVARVAQMSANQDRLRAAEEHIRVLVKSVSRVRVRQSSPPAGQRVLLDGAIFPTDPEGAPVDAGEHVVRIDAPGHEPWEMRVAIARTQETKEVSPELVRVPVAVSVPGATRPNEPRTLFHLGIGALGLGAVGAGIGTAFGLTAMSRGDSSGCDGTNCSAGPPDGPDKVREARSAGTISTIAFIAGGAVAATGVVLLIASSRGRDTTVALTPRPSGASVSLGATF